MSSTRTILVDTTTTTLPEPSATQCGQLGRFGGPYIYPVTECTGNSQKPYQALTPSATPHLRLCSPRAVDATPDAHSGAGISGTPMSYNLPIRLKRKPFDIVENLVSLPPSVLSTTGSKRKCASTDGGEYDSEEMQRRRELYACEPCVPFRLRKKLRLAACETKSGDGSQPQVASYSTLEVPIILVTEAESTNAVSLRKGDGTRAKKKARTAPSDTTGRRVSSRLKQKEEAIELAKAKPEKQNAASAAPKPKPIGAKGKPRNKK
ncbi:hypothetical protein BKA70DRAFT_1421700 [Coprinopsis sp. MPI-PUGE-AT-0042]|nr:hypothetical protein BKA70DRAFT_1421700 [Coprinopsis sp. MPI-PUGE-AT-0042]